MSATRLWFALACLPLFANGETDPFTTQTPGWIEEIKRAKPYDLEIAHGETGADLATQEIAEFLKNARTLRVAVAASDAGLYESGENERVFFRLTPAGDDKIALKIVFMSDEGGSREIRSDLVLWEGAWVVMGGLTRETERGRLNYVTAFRIKKRE